jgi:death-on-curing family protein
MVLLTVQEVLTIRRRLVFTLIGDGAWGAVEPVAPDRLESAVARQETGLGRTRKYETVHELAATLFFGVNMAHAFENGNKRTALVTLLVFLDRNKHVLVDTPQDELYEMTRQVAAHEFPLRGRDERRTADAEVGAIASWLRPRVRPLVLGDRHMRFSELRRHLEAQGCTFEEPSHNYIKIRREGHSIRTGFPRHDFDIAVSEVKRIRKALHVDEAHGIDSAAFYNFEASVDTFVNQYRQVLSRLALI